MTDAEFDISLLDYELPPDRIAQTPLARRDQAKLLIVDRQSGQLANRSISDLPELLRPSDLLILNNTRVIPAKFSLRRATGGRVGGLFLRETGLGTWEVMLEGARRCRIGETLRFETTADEPVDLELLERHDAGHWIVKPKVDLPTESILERVGHAPLPPYIHRDKTDDSEDAADRERYQTVYAQTPGAVAAPTAGLHFTSELLDAISNRGIETAFVTLHVGLGTFKPVTATRLGDHVMHKEWFELPETTATAIHACRERGGRVVAVGTTAVRTLESCVNDPESRTVRAATGATDLFIYPRRRLQIVDALLTNFHLPRSTLLALVMAFAGVERTRAAYQHAVKSDYRFFSYGDAMLIV